MERIGTLLEKLQQQFVDKLPANELLVTVQMLEAELSYLQFGNDMRNDIVIEISSAVKNMNEKTVEILKIDEADIEAELQEVKRNADLFNTLSTQNKPQISFDDDSISAMAYPIQSQQINKTVAVKALNFNENNSSTVIKQTVVNDPIDSSPIKDLKKSIGNNDRILFIYELFRGDETMYERSVKTINNFSILPEAEFWIERELKVKIGWNENNPVVKQFNHLVKRRFSSI